MQRQSGCPHRSVRCSRRDGAKHRFGWRCPALDIETVSITNDPQQLAVVVPAQPVVVLPAVLCSKSALGSGSCFVSGGQRDRVSAPMRAGKIPTGTGRPDNRLKCCRPGIRHKKATRLSCTDAAAGKNQCARIWSNTPPSLKCLSCTAGQPPSSPMVTSLTGGKPAADSLATTGSVGR